MLATQPSRTIDPRVQRIAQLWNQNVPVKEIAEKEGLTPGYMHVWIVYARKDHPDLFPKRPPGGFNRVNGQQRSPKRESLRPVISELWLQGLPVEEIAKKVDLKVEHVRTIAYVERKRGNDQMFPKRCYKGGRPPGSQGGKPVDPKTVEEISRLWLDGLSLKQLSQQYQWSVKRMSEWICLRRAEFPNLFPRRPRYVFPKKMLEDSGVYA